MSMSAHGSATLACVCRCSSGLRSASSPAIHIFAGENVCIQAITPMQRVVGGGLEASRRIAVGVGQHRLPDDRGRDVRRGVERRGDRLRLLATWRSVSSP